jgi:hypothetical protein
MSRICVNKSRDLQKSVMAEELFHKTIGQRDHQLLPVDKEVEKIVDFQSNKASKYYKEMEHPFI